MNPQCAGEIIKVLRDFFSVFVILMVVLSRLASRAVLRQPLTSKGEFWIAERITVPAMAILSVRTLTYSTGMGLLHITSRQSCGNILSKSLFPDRWVRANH